MQTKIDALYTLLIDFLGVNGFDPEALNLKRLRGDLIAALQRDFTKSEYIQALQATCVTYSGPYSLQIPAYLTDKHQALFLRLTEKVTYGEELLRLSHEDAKAWADLVEVNTREGIMRGS